MTRGPELYGEMMRLRPIEARDAERMWESVQDPESNRLTGTTAEFTREQIDEWAATISDRDGPLRLGHHLARQAGRPARERRDVR